MQTTTIDEKPPELSRSVRTPLWRNRDYMLLWSGQTVSLVGTGITQTAFPLLVWDISHSAALVGLVGGIGSLPYLLLSLIVGALIDHWDRKRVMILCDIGRALNLISVLVTLMIGHLTVVQLCLNALTEGTLFVFFNLAEVACLPRVVAKEQLAAATAQNEATSGITVLVSPLLGGILYGLRQTLPFLADAVSYGVSVLTLALIKTEFQEKRAKARLHLLADIRAGLSWLWHQPVICYTAFLTGCLNFASAGFVPILVVLVKQQHGSSFVYGTILTIAGIGAIIGSLLGGPVKKRFRLGQVILWTVWVEALLWPLYAVVSNPILLGALTALIFVSGPIYNVVQFSYRLALIPDELQGRVNSVFRLMAFGFMPLGWVVTGLLLQWVQVVPTILILCAFLFGVAVLTTLNPYVRNAGR